MLQFGACPVCKTDIDRDRLQHSIFICQACGWSDNKKDTEADHKSQNRFMALATVLSVLLIAGFIHTVTWDTHSVEILGLKAKQMTGSASETDLSRIADICFQRKNPNCMIEALAEASQGKSVSNDTLARLGKVLMQTKKPEKAVIVFTHYFNQGGSSSDIAFRFAKVLAQTGKFAESDEYFRFVLDSKPKVLQITVTQSYVDMLVKSGQLKSAKKLIESFRKKSDNAAFFMDRELKDIKIKIASR